MKMKITPLVTLALTICLLLSGSLLGSALASDDIPFLRELLMSSGSQTDTDLTPPALVHEPVALAFQQEDLTITATVTDDIAISFVRLFYRSAGSGFWKVETLRLVQDDLYSVTLNASALTMESLEYFLQASDGTNNAYAGSEAQPYQVTLRKHITIDSISPAQVNLEVLDDGITAHIYGSEFTGEMVLTVGGIDTAYQLVSSTELTFQLPPLGHGVQTILLKTDCDQAAIAVAYYDPFSSVQISANTPVFSGESFQLPVSVSCTGPVTMLSVRLQTSISDLTELSFALSEVNAFATAELTTDASGIVTLSITSQEPLVLDGCIGYLQGIAIGGVTHKDSPITIKEASINEVPAGVSLGCSLSVEPCFTISGCVTYFGGTMPLSGVQLTLSDGQTTITDENGCFSFSGIRVENVTISASFQTSANGAITAQDAALLLQALPSLGADLHELQRKAADVDGDGRLTQDDAMLLLQADVGLEAITNTWFFTVLELSLTENVTDASLTGILLGDVSGNWAPSPSDAT